MTYGDVKIKINGVEIPPPTDMDFELNDVDVESGRNVSDGVMSRNRLRSDVFKVTLTYTIDDADSISKLLNLISGEYFNVELFDLKQNKRTTKSCYAGNKAYKLICIDRVWVSGFKVSLVER